MSKPTVSVNSFFGTCVVLASGLFVGLKLTDIINWSWWWVLTPVWILLLTLALVVVIAAVVLIFSDDDDPDE